MKLRRLPPASVVRSALLYDPASGLFTWRHRPGMVCGWNKKWAGKRAGTANKKGISIFLNGVAYYAHRLAWVYIHGDSLGPETQIDHVNCNCFDNCIANLRPATHGQNASNSRRRTNKALPKGVSTQSAGRGGFRARVGVDGAVVHLGTFATPEEAHAAYLAAAKKAKGEFARAE